MNVINAVNRNAFLQELGASKIIDAAEIKAKIQASVLQVMPGGIYAAKDATGKTVVRMFDPSDSKNIGVVSLAEGRPAKNALHLIKGIRVTAVTAGAAVTPALIKAGAFVGISGIAGMQNGVLTVKSNKRTIIEELPLSQFITPEDKDLGVFWLNNPKWILPDQPLEAEFEFPVELPANTIVKIEFLTEFTAV